MAEDRNFVWITAEASDIVTDPFDCKPLISKAEVVMFEIWGTREAEDVESIVEGDNHSVLCLGQILPAVERAVDVASCEAYE